MSRGMTPACAFDDFQEASEVAVKGDAIRRSLMKYLQNWLYTESLPIDTNGDGGRSDAPRASRHGHRRGMRPPARPSHRHFNPPTSYLCAVVPSSLSCSSTLPLLLSPSTYCHSVVLGQQLACSATWASGGRCYHSQMLPFTDAAHSQMLPIHRCYHSQMLPFTDATIH
eukprot:2742706-Pleurochrysis_carterae.AAC.2